MAEGLLDDDAAPLATLTPVEARVGQVLGDDGKVGGGNGQVEGVIAARASGAVQFGHGLGQLPVGSRIVEGPRDETQARAQLIPRALVEAGTRVGLDGGAHIVLEVAGAPIAPGEAGQRESRMEETAVGEVVDRWQ